MGLMKRNLCAYSETVRNFGSKELLGKFRGLRKSGCHLLFFKTLATYCSMSRKVSIPKIHANDFFLFILYLTTLLESEVNTVHCH